MSSDWILFDLKVKTIYSAKRTDEGKQYYGIQKRVFMKVGIIGAGMAGLSCAEVLFRHGIQVEIFDENAYPGGRCCTIREQGFTLDVGAQFFLGSFHRTRDIAKRMGLESSCQRFNAPYGYLKRGRISDFSPYITSGKLGSGRFIGTGSIAWNQKIQIGTLFSWIILNASRFDLPSNIKSEDLDKTSFFDFVYKKCGRETYEEVIAPLLLSWNLEDPMNINAHSGLMFFRHIMTGVWTMMGGVGYLPRKIAREIKKVRLNKKVESLDSKKRGVDLSVDGNRKTFDAVVLATDATDAGDLIAGSNVEKALKKIQYTKTTIVVHALERRPEKIADRLAILAPEKEGHPYVSVTNSAVKFIGNVPPRATALNWYLAEKYNEQSDQDLLKMIEHEAHGIFLDYTRPVFTRIIRWKRGLVKPGMSLRENINELPIEVEPNLFLAGSYFQAFGVEGAVYSGREAAFRIIRKMDGR